MIVCTKCGARNEDGTEFCANPGCGAYLGYVGKKTEALAGGITVAVAPTVVTVRPGEEAIAEIRIRNKSNVVDQYDIQVVGEPSRWTVAEPTTLSLFPDAEGVARVRFRPVRSPELPAGRKPFSINVQSRASGAISGHQEGAVELAPFLDAALAITPRTSRGGTSASHRITIENRGNVPMHAMLDAADPDEALTFAFDNPVVSIPPGQSAFVQLTVQPRATFYDGPPQPHAFKVQLATDGASSGVADATFLQEAVPRPIPRKFPLVPVLLGVLAIALISGAFVERDPLMKLVGITRPTPSPATAATARASVSAQVSPSAIVTVPPILVTIPNVACLNQIAAEQAITSAGLKYVPSLVANAAYGAGIVFKTQPLAGGQVPQGSEITAFVSTGPPPNSPPTLSPCLLRIVPSLPFQIHPSP
jgi:hypothetical protein